MKNRILIGMALFASVCISYVWLPIILPCFALSIAIAHEVKNLWLDNPSRRIYVFQLGLFATIGVLDMFYMAMIDPQNLFLLVMTVSISDAFQYFIGHSIGRTKMNFGPSPHKTFEGYMGAALVAILCTFFPDIGLIQGSWWVASGILGDLYVSYCKRRIQIKDTSKTLGDHGGWLDRIDGIIGALAIDMWFSV